MTVSSYRGLIPWAGLENRALDPYGEQRISVETPDGKEVSSSTAWHVPPFAAVVVDDQTSRSHGINIRGGASSDAPDVGTRWDVHVRPI